MEYHATAQGFIFLYDYKADRQLSLIHIFVLLAIFVYEGSLAFFHAQTDISAKISAGNLGIELVQDMDKEKITKTENGFQIRSSMSGDEIKDRVYVEKMCIRDRYSMVCLRGKHAQ